MPSRGFVSGPHRLRGSWGAVRSPRTADALNFVNHAVRSGYVDPRAVDIAPVSRLSATRVDPLHRASSLLLAFKDGVTNADVVPFDADNIDHVLVRANPTGMDGTHRLDQSDFQNWKILEALQELGIKSGYVDRTGPLDVVTGGHRTTTRPFGPDSEANLHQDITDIMELDPGVITGFQSTSGRNVNRHLGMAVRADLSDIDQINQIKRVTGLPLEVVASIVSPQDWQLPNDGLITKSGRRYVTGFRRSPTSYGDDIPLVDTAGVWNFRGPNASPSLFDAESYHVAFVPPEVR